MSSDPMSSDPMSSDPMSSDPMSSDPMSRDPMSSDPMSRRNRSRGYSLIDVAVAVVLFTAIFTIAARFVLSLAETSASSVTRAEVRRDVAAARRGLENDTARLVACDRSGFGAPFAEFNDAGGYGEHSFAGYGDVDGDGHLDLVAWRVNGGDLQRAVASGSGAGCDTLTITTGAWRTVVRNVRLVNDPNPLVFTALTAGRRSDHTGSCRGVDADACRFEAVRVQFVAGNEASGPVLVDLVLPVTTAPGRL
jgi:type II secretory pathway component PulJ